jgi:hypothetical protein
MTDDRSETAPDRAEPDEPGDVQPAVRGDIGTSLGAPAAEQVPPTDSEQPGDDRGPAGSGVVPGRGQLGSWKQPDGPETRS